MTDTHTFCEDWVAYFRAPDGSWSAYNSEYWPGWLDLPEGADTESGAVERHVLPFLLELPPDTRALYLNPVPARDWPSLDRASSI